MPRGTFLGHTSIRKTASWRRFQPALGRLAICQFGVLSGVSAAQAAPFSPPIACRQFAPVTDFDAQRFFSLRLILMQIYRDKLVWYTTCEELTELLFVFSAGWVLWIFRHGLSWPATSGTVDESR